MNKPTVPTLEQSLLKSMEYIGPKECCATCLHYVPTDMSGNPSGQDEHCTLNPAIDLPIEAGGRCRFHQPKA
jgi:hypothetical protein